jgi:hypothetical protein
VLIGAHRIRVPLDEEHPSGFRRKRCYWLEEGR